MSHLIACKNNKNSTKFPENQSGNVIVILLVIIALIAALTAVTMRSSNRASSNISTEQARILAEKLMRQAKSYETGVQAMMLSGHCSEKELSFQNATTTKDYTNASTPSDNHCKLFNSAGSGLSYTAPDEAVMDSTKSALSDYGDWIFTGTQCVLGLGSDDNNTCVDNELSLILAVPHIAESVCVQINELSGVTNPSGNPPQEDFDSTAAAFTGSFSAATDPEIGEGASGSNLERHATGCFETTSGAWNGSYVFYHALLSR